MYTSQRLVEFDHFFCDNCRIYVYDELVGDVAFAIAPCTRIERLPVSWRCPKCGAKKDQLRACTLVDGFTCKEWSRDPVNASGVLPGMEHLGSRGVKGQ